MSNPRDQINKASWTLMEGIKDAVGQNVTMAAKDNKIGDIKTGDLGKLLMIINASIEEGYHRAARTFGKVVDNAVDAAENAAWVQGNTASVGTSPPTGKAKKKPA